MLKSDRTSQLARRMHNLKARTNRSYEALSRRIGVSRSTLHRYCRGEVVPPTYDVIIRFSTVCGATRDETKELLKYWSLAVDGNRPDPARCREKRPNNAKRRGLMAIAALAGGVWRRGRSRAGGTQR